MKDVPEPPWWPRIRKVLSLKRDDRISPHEGLCCLEDVLYTVFDLASFRVSTLFGHFTNAFVVQDAFGLGLVVTSNIGDGKRDEMFVVTQVLPSGSSVPGDCVRVVFTRNRRFLEFHEIPGADVELVDPKPPSFQALDEPVLARFCNLKLYAKAFGPLQSGWIERLRDEVYKLNAQMAEALKNLAEDSPVGKAALARLHDRQLSFAALFRKGTPVSGEKAP